MDTKNDKEPPIHSDDPLELLIKAIHENDSKTVKSILMTHHDQKKTLVNSKDKENYSLLHLATKRNAHYILQFLLDAGAQVDMMDPTRATALHWAASHNYLESCEVLCNYGASVIAKDANDHCPIHLCFNKTNPNYKMAELLLFFKCDINVKGKHGCTVLHICAQEGNLAGLKWLSKISSIKMNVRDNTGQTALMRAVSNERHYHVENSAPTLEVVKYLLEMGIDHRITDENGRNIMFQAASTGHLEVMIFFKSKFASEWSDLIHHTDLEGKNVTHLAIIRQQHKVLKYLHNLNLGHYDKEDSFRLTPIHYIIKQDDPTLLAITQRTLTLDEKLNILGTCKNSHIDLSKEPEKLVKRQLQQLSKFPWVVNLNLSNHPVSLLPTPPFLTTLALVSCDLREFPLGIEGLPNMTSLDLSHNQISIVPPRITKMELVRLNLSHNSIFEWQRELNYQNRMVWLNLAHNMINFENISEKIGPIEMSTGEKPLLSPRGLSSLKQTFSMLLKKDDPSLTKKQSDTKLTKHPSDLKLRVIPSGGTLRSPRSDGPKSPREEPKESFLKTTFSFLTGRKSPEKDLKREAPVHKEPMNFTTAKSFTTPGTQSHDVHVTVDDIREMEGVTEVEERLVNKSPRTENILRSLTYLNLSSNGMKEFPKEFHDLESIIELDLSGNHQVSFNLDAHQLTGLKKLNLSRNEYKMFPSFILNKETLQDVNLSKNHLFILPPLTNLINLSNINISECKISSLVGAFDPCKKLKRIDASKNQLMDISQLNIPDLEEFILDDNHIENIDGIGNHKNLVKFTAARNQISDIPDVISELSNLIALDLSENRIEKISNQISKLHKLERVNLSYNMISWLPSLSGKIQELKVENNYLTQVSLGDDVHSLRSVDCSVNNLSNIASFYKCHHLTYLNVSENVIRNVEAGIGEMKSLKDLVLTSNEIEKIPNDITRITTLQNLLLNYNSMTSISDIHSDWIATNCINFECSYSLPLMVTKEIWFCTAETANNKVLLNSCKINKVLWFVRGNLPRLRHEEDIQNEVIFYDPLKDNMYDIFVHCFKHTEKGPVAVASDQGFELGAVLIIAMLMLSKNISLKEAIDTLQKLKKFELQSDCYRILDKFERNRLDGPSNTELKFILEDVADRENFKTFVKRFGKEKYVELWENIETAFKKSLTPFERGLFAQEIYSQFLQSDASSQIEVDPTISEVIEKKIAKEDYSINLFDDLEKHLVKLLEPHCADFKNSDLFIKKPEKVSPYQSARTPRTPRDRSTSPSIISPKQRSLSVKGSAPNSNLGSKTSSKNNSTATSPEITPRGENDPKDSKVNSDMYDIPVIDVTSPRKDTMEKKASVPKLDLKIVKK